MIFAFIADVHGNIEALDAVLQDIEDHWPDARIVCAGDVVGYGPDPEACIERLRASKIPCVIGNHEEMVLGRRDFSRCGHAGIVGAQYAEKALSGAAMRYLDELPGRLLPAQDIVVCHGDLLDADTYVSSADAASSAMRQLGEQFPDGRLLVCGHTHHAASYSASSGFRLQAVDSTLELEATERWLINPGAVGQSRDGSMLARYAVLDNAAGRVTWRGVAYDHEKTLDKMKAAGLVARVDLQRPVGARRYLESIKRRWARLRAGR